jgi:hypothetical protein
MIKFLFFDYWDLESVTGFKRELRQPEKCEKNPLFLADKPWENGNMQFYGSVIKVPGKPFQCWYSMVHPPFTIYLAYAESSDGIKWHKPLFDIWEYEGKKTNVVCAQDPHGAAVIFDDADPREDWKYKMLCGAAPSKAICAFHSSDGVHWIPANHKFPVLPTGPDCPMAFLKTPDGRYAAFHRLAGYGRRVFRSESCDFKFWNGEPRMIMEPDAGDPPQTQFYGMGAASYGCYEIGTLWMYHTDPEDTGHGKMNGYQEAEFTYARQGHCWHRAAQGTPFIPHGMPGSWEQGNLQCASQPVYLEDEIRYYYAGTTQYHCSSWELKPQKAGLGMASMKPDRFVALTAGSKEAELLSYAFKLPYPDLYVNAKTDKNGWVKVELIDSSMKPIQGFSGDQAKPITGDGTAIPIKYTSRKPKPVGESVRIRVTAKNASVYSVFSCSPDSVKRYWEFTSPRPNP